MKRAVPVGSEEARRIVNEVRRIVLPEGTGAAARKARWLAKHPTYKRDDARRWRAANREKCRAANARWKKRHPEKYAAQRRRHRERYRDRDEAYLREWRQRHPEKIKEYRQRTSANKKRRILRQAVLGGPAPTEADQRKPPGRD